MRELQKVCLFFGGSFFAASILGGACQIYSTTNGGRKTQVNKKLSTEVQEKVNKGPQPLNKKIHEALGYSLTGQVGQVGEHQNM